VEPESDRSSNLFSEDRREGAFGQIPYLNTASFRLEHLS